MRGERFHERPMLFLRTFCADSQPTDIVARETQVRLGNRAFEILSILVQRAGELISKQELISLVWPDTFVDESNLKVNIAAIRKALDEGGSHPSCIATIIGRGYRFIEPVEACETNSCASSEMLTCFC